MQDFARSVVTEADVLKSNSALNVGERYCSTRILIFRLLVEDLLRTLEPSQRLGKLRANRDNLNDGCN